MSAAPQQRPQFPMIALSEPRPLLDPGSYQAMCTEATIAWSRQWGKWIAILVMEPQSYAGRPYNGKLCKFLNVGSNPERPYAGPQSDFRQLWVELNGAQTTRAEVTMEVFEGRLYDVTVDTVTVGRKEKKLKPEHWYSVVREIHPAGVQAFLPPKPEPLNPSTIDDLSTLRTQITHSTYQHSNTNNTPEQSPPIAESVLVTAKSDIRSDHERCKDSIFKCFRHLNDGIDPSWDETDDWQLGLLLKSTPSLTPEEFHHWLGHYSKSENINPAKRPRDFLPKITDYAAGPLNQYGRPLEVKKKRW